jgi:hypothetical protein
MCGAISLSVTVGYSVVGRGRGKFGETIPPERCMGMFDMAAFEWVYAGLCDANVASTANSGDSGCSSKCMLFRRPSSSASVVRKSPSRDRESSENGESSKSWCSIGWVRGAIVVMNMACTVTCADTVWLNKRCSHWSR